MGGLERLLAGNRRFLAGGLPPEPETGEIARLAAEGQRPYAVVLSCSDARVPPELVFCCGLGEIFTVRTAGNVVSDLEMGSVEFGVLELGARLVLVMGHTGCGAVAGAMAGTACGCLGKVLAEVIPAVEEARRHAHTPEQVARLAEALNIRHSLALLRENPVLAEVEGLQFAAARYDTGTGQVHLLDGD